MSLGNLIKRKRQEKSFTMQELAAQVRIDQALISKYESGKRFPSDKHLLALAVGLDVSLHSLRREVLAEKIVRILAYEQNPEEILKVAETRIEYLSSKRNKHKPKIDDDIRLRLEKIDALKEKWTSKKPLNSNQLEKMVEYFDVSYTYDSNRIEGNTLTLQETHLVINEGITISGKSMREHLEAINHQEAISFIRSMVDEKHLINKRNTLDLHRLVLKSIDSDNAGIYRKVGVRISGSNHIPPDALHLEELMSQFFDFYMTNYLLLHPVLLAAEVHERLVSIHPFIDGNGRTARLLMNFILLNNGYTITNFKGDQQSRMKYYQSLEEVQVNNNPKPFYELVCENLEKSLEEHLQMV